MRFLFLFLSFFGWSCVQTSGPLLLAGGGHLPATFFEKGIQLAQKNEVHVLIFPQASQREESGSESAEVWLKAGGATTHVADLSSPEGSTVTLQEIQNADILWFTGGSQLRLMKAVQNAQILPAIQHRWKQGAVVGGTSAGAAAMGTLMISGAPQPKPYVKGAMAAHDGLGLCPQFLVDQHFTQRNRNHRLLTAVLDHPDVIGLGISESTALIIQGDTAVVWGDGPVHLYDARHADVTSMKEGQSAKHLSFTLLKTDDTFSW